MTTAFWRGVERRAIKLGATGDEARDIADRGFYSASEADIVVDTVQLATGEWVPAEVAP